MTARSARPAPPVALMAAAALLALSTAPAALAARVPGRLGAAAIIPDAAVAAAGLAAAAAAVDRAAAAPSSSLPKALPVVMWHGMGDSCCALGSIGGVAKFIESRLGVFVHSIATGEGELRDIASSFVGNVNEQVAAACEELRQMKDELSGGFNMVGFSQGGQFLRAVVQRCGHELPGPVHTLVTMGAQHAGVSNAPACAGSGGVAPGGGAAAKACAAAQAALAVGAYSPWVREHIVQAQYFKSPADIEEYLERNVFLPDINNERREDDGGDSEGGAAAKTAAASPLRSSLYRRNLSSLEKLVLYKFENDTVVEPAESSHFGFWGAVGTADEGRVVPLRESAMYTEDWIGLRALDESDALVFASAPGNHMQFSMRWFEEDVMDRWLAGPPEEGWLERARAAQRAAVAAADAAPAA